MKKRTLLTFTLLVLIIFVSLVFPGRLLCAAEKNLEKKVDEMAERIEELMEEGKIPGLSLVVVGVENQVVVKGLGYADLGKKNPVTPDTLFELASCSKAFTALAVLKCERDGLLALDDPVSKYFPWFSAAFEGKEYDITIRQLLHQTSGIPFKSIARIPVGTDRDSLEQTVRNVSGMELAHIPGKKHLYATVNYDILGAIIEKAAGMSFEDYMADRVFSPLGLLHTAVGVDKANDSAATGYKISFFAPRKYDAPLYRGNNPAGYIVSSGKDIARWLGYQLGEIETDMAPLIEKTHVPDQSVVPNPRVLSYYAMGWYDYLNDNDIKDHPGNNPNFTAYLAFSKKEQLGVAVLANSNSDYTRSIGYYVLNFLRGEPEEPLFPGSKVDGVGSVASFVLCFIILVTLVFIVSIFVDAARGRRRFEAMTPIKALKMIAMLVVFLPFLGGIYLIAPAMFRVDWKTAFVWAPVSFKAAIFLLLAVIALTYLGYVISSLFPQKNKYIRSLPMVILLSLLAGGANAVVIFLITGSLYTDMKLFYQVYYFALAFFVYIMGRKILQTRLTRITFDIIYDMRMKLVEKVFYTSYQSFEKIERGRVLATLNNDTGQIGEAANLMVQFVTSVITTFGAFVYLATIAFWATAVTTCVVAVIATVYVIVTQKTRVYFEDARDTQNVFMELVNGLVDGFKELSLHQLKKDEYKDDIQKTCDEFRQKLSDAFIRFINAFMIGESLLIVVLGSVSFAVPRLFPEITVFTLMSFIMVLLYLIGPINGILNTIPAIMRLRVAWNRVQGFIEDIPANIDPKEVKRIDLKDQKVERIVGKGLRFEYEQKDGERSFGVGPLDFEARKGEAVFIIGGNGSGKTTLAKLLCGLYKVGEGTIEIDGKSIDSNQLGEYFSTVFGDYHLFEKLYNIDVTGKEGEVKTYLKTLRLSDKVALEGNAFTTIKLSGGQRKRLALLQCYLENCPIFLFDEVAADQDPTFRKFFYRTLLKEMKEQGKIVIAITHDDHYFDVADKIVKMDMGKVDVLEEGSTYQVTR